MLLNGIFIELDKESEFAEEVDCKEFEETELSKMFFLLSGTGI